MAAVIREVTEMGLFLWVPCVDFTHACSHVERASMTAIIGQIFFFNGKPMLVDIMTAIIGPFWFSIGKPMKVEQMIVIIGRIRFFQCQAKSGLLVLLAVQRGWRYHLHSNNNRRRTNT